MDWEIEAVKTAIHPFYKRRLVSNKMPRAIDLWRPDYARIAGSWNVPDYLKVSAAPRESREAPPE